MIIASSYPVIMTDRVETTSQFYEKHFGFERTFESDWYVSLQTSEGGQTFELALLRYNHQSVPDGFRKPGQGFLLNFEVADATAAHDRFLKERDVVIVKPLTDEAFGQRHVILKDPSGNLVDVIENIPPTQEFLNAYR